MTSLFKYVESVLEKADQTAARTLQTINSQKSEKSKPPETQILNTEEYVKSKTEELEKQLQQLQEEKVQPASSSGEEKSDTQKSEEPQKSEEKKSNDELEKLKIANDLYVQIIHVNSSSLKTNITSLHQEVGELSKKNEELSQKNKDVNCNFDGKWVTKTE
jgi:hypothetical protein